MSSGFALGQAYWNRGDLTQAEQVLTATLAALPRARRKTHSGTTGTASLMCLVSLSHTHSLTGQFEQAFARSREALEMAAETERPYDQSYAHAAQGLAHLTVGEFETAVHHLEQALRIARAHEIMLLIPHAVRYLGRAYALTGRMVEAEKLLVEAVSQTRAQSLGALCGWCSATLGFTRAIAGARSEAETLLTDALDFACRYGYRPLEVYASRLMGLGETTGDDTASRSSEHWLRRAATLAEEIGMRPELAHCHHGLGNLLARSERADEAQVAFGTALELYGTMSMAHDQGMARAALAGCRSPREVETTPNG